MFGSGLPQEKSSHTWSLTALQKVVLWEDETGIRYQLNDQKLAGRALLV